MVAGIAAQLDTAADRTVLPASLVERLKLVRFGEISVMAFGGILTNTSTFLVRILISGVEEKPLIVEVLSSPGEPHILLGRDVLNGFKALFDGPNEILEFG